MTRKGSPGTRIRRAALRELRDAAQRGDLPDRAPADLEFGQYAGFWVAPGGKVYARSPSPPDRPQPISVIVDRCGCGAASGKCGLAYRSAVDWAPAGGWPADAEWWQAADGSRMAVTDRQEAR